MGGLDWAALEICCAHLGVTDVEALVDALLVIKHRPKPGDETQDDETPPEDEND
jgi:hypothetical protein